MAALFFCLFFSPFSSFLSHIQKKKALRLSKTPPSLTSCDATAHRAVASPFLILMKANPWLPLAVPGSVIGGHAASPIADRGANPCSLLPPPAAVASVAFSKKAGENFLCIIFCETTFLTVWSPLILSEAISLSKKPVLSVSKTPASSK